MEKNKIDWSMITDNKEAIELIKQREELEEKIIELDENALINWELHLLGFTPKDSLP